ncbi:cytochrome P450 [Umezawaea sp. Da 62-37]|uniref:cytochrome P450 n=1 Tax=Umezawaea sp. Da 62-37 TaxID=3075927 RepID=UPI0028F6CDF2|nr:cytochrome P450 [Umezawaea sp. Da 62-37]WNV86272.1 cytochrome P450 [Umezawaea sp. Da 62-37]
MDTTRAEPVGYPFNRAEDLELDERYARSRAGRQLVRVKMPYGEEGWLATRYEDVRIVLGDHRFSRAAAAAAGLDEPRTSPQTVGPGVILSMDPPEHSRVRRLAGKAFTHRNVERLRPKAEQVANELVDRMVEHGSPVDLIENFASPLPVAMICTMLGVPVEDQHRFLVWSEVFASATTLTAEETQARLGSLVQYMSELLRQRQEKPEDDLLSGLVLARDQDDRFTGEEILSLAIVLLGAGHENITSQIPNFVYTLLHHPDELARLRADRSLIPQAVEELMRYIPLGLGPVLARYALVDIEVGGVLVRAGEPVVASLGSANRDEDAFDRADVLDLTRQPGPHVGFGHGPHHCLGAALARMEMQIAMETLLDRFPDLRIAVPDEDLKWRTGTFMRSVLELPITW